MYSIANLTAENIDIMQFDMCVCVYVCVYEGKVREKEGRVREGEGGKKRGKRRERE